MILHETTNLIIFYVLDKRRFTCAHPGGQLHIDSPPDKQLTEAYKKLIIQAFKEKLETL